MTAKEIQQELEMYIDPVKKETATHIRFSR